MGKGGYEEKKYVVHISVMQTADMKKNWDICIYIIDVMLTKDGFCLWF